MNIFFVFHILNKENNTTKAMHHIHLNVLFNELHNFFRFSGTGRHGMSTCNPTLEQKTKIHETG